MNTPLRQNPCKQQCNWIGTGRVRDGLALFMCTGCNSEWVRSEPWTPANADGSIAPQVLAERERAKA